MTGSWRKLGRVLQASGEPLSQSHAMAPTPYVMADRVRVFYASCDEDLRGRIFFADFDLEPPFNRIGAGRGPVLDLGPPGAFDCDGVTPSQALADEGGLALLYIGWRRGPAHAPYSLFAGLARSHDHGETFARASTPLLAPRPGEGLFRTAPFLERRPDGWRMLYIGGDAFTTGSDGKRLPLYSLMEMSGAGPWDWDVPSRVLLAPDVAAGEIGIGRPVAYVSGGQDRLMLSIRTPEGYRLVETARDFAPGRRPAMEPVVPEPFEAWEGQMTCFGAPCRVGAYELLFYNGDGFGRTGVGLAWRPA